MAKCKPWVNSLCGYTSVRVAKIKDWRLGVTYFSLLFAIFAYIIIYTLIFEQRYRLRALDIVGSTRLQLHSPAPIYTLPPQNLTYCSTDGSEGNTIIVDGSPVPLYPCRYLDQFDAVDPYLEPAALFMATRITQYPQTLPAGCAPTQLDPQCQFINGNSSTFYVAQPELFTLLIDHTFSSASLRIAQSAVSMPGKMIDQQGNTINPCDDYPAGLPCDPHVKIGLVNQGADIFPLKTLLRAAGIPSLEAISPAINETHRSAGLILVLSVQYSNFWSDTNSFRENAFTYTYQVQSVLDAEFKGEQPLTSPGSGVANRTILDRHGLRVLVKQSGNVGVFDTATLLITLTSSMGLLAVATLVVDILATRVLPLRALYRQYKEFESVNLPEVNLTERDLTMLENEDLVNPKPAFLRRLASTATRFRGFGRGKHTSSGSISGSTPTTPLLLAAEGDGEHGRESFGGDLDNGADGDDHDIESRGVSMDEHQAEAAAYQAQVKAMGRMQKSSSALILNAQSGVASAYGLPVVAVVASSSTPGSARPSINNSASPLHSTSKSGLTGPRRSSAASHNPRSSPQGSSDDLRRGSGISLPLQSGYGAGAGSTAASPPAPPGVLPAAAAAARPSTGVLGAGLMRPPMASIASAANDDSDNEA